MAEAVQEMIGKNLGVKLKLSNQSGHLFGNNETRKLPNGLYGIDWYFP